MENFIFWAVNLFKKNLLVFSLRDAEQVRSLSFKPFSSKTTRVLVVVNNLQPITKILRLLYKPLIIKTFLLY